MCPAMELRKPQGRIPAEVRPHLPALIKGMSQVGVGTLTCVDGIAVTFNVTRSTVLKATKLRSQGAAR